MTDTVFAHLFRPGPSSKPVAKQRLAPQGEDDFDAGEVDPSALPLPVTASDLIGQWQQLLVVFTEHEGREPGPEDTEFWSAMNTLTERFTQGYRPSGSTPSDA